MKKLKLNPQTIFIKIYCDFQTILFEEKHYVVCYSLVLTTEGDSVNKFKTIDLASTAEVLLKSDALLKNFLQDCLELVEVYKSHKNKVLFLFHNLGRFDAFFLLKKLTSADDFVVKLNTRDNLFYQIIATKNNISLEFRDSKLFLPISLKEISNTFCTIQKKDEFIFDNTAKSYIENPQLKDKILDLCISNSFVLQEGFDNFLTSIENHFHLQPLQVLSLPGFALRLFRYKYYNENSYLIEPLDQNKDTFIRQSYHGGIVNVYKPHLENGYHYDVNSLYPYIMKTSKMPVGKGKWTSNIDINTFFGFIKVEVDCPNFLHKPFLSVYDQNLGLICPTGRWTGIYFSEEIKYALTLGYKFKFLNGIAYEQHVIFNTFIDDIYKIRLQNEKGTSINLLMKLLMNSLYGKFGMRSTILQSKMISKKDLNYYISNFSIKNINDFNEKLLITYDSKILPQKLETLGLGNFIDIKNLYLNKGIQNENVAVQIASAITAYARIYMDKFKQDESLDVYYSDTDSIFCRNPLPDAYISDNKLGLFKLENEITEAFFLAPKIYMLKSKNNKILIKCKGLENDLITEKDIKEHYYKKINLIVKDINHFTRNKTSFFIAEKKTQIHIEAAMLKRKKIFKNGIWCDTMPLSYN